MDGLNIREVQVIKNDLGEVIKFAKPPNERCAEIYFSTIYRGHRKGWKMHKRIVQHLMVIEGKVEFSFVDRRMRNVNVMEEKVIADSSLGYFELEISPGICYEFKNASDVKAVIVNWIDEEYDDTEAVTAKTPWEIDLC